jgi:hypothetical protein
MSVPTFEGSPEEQALATEIFQLMVRQGAMFAKDAPIRQSLSNLADFLAQQRNIEPDVIAQKIDATLSVNSSVFQREQQEDEVIYTTSRLGAFQPRQPDMLHTFKERLYQPENPLPVDDISVVVSTSRPTLTTVEPVYISDYWQEQSGMTPGQTAQLETPPAEAATANFEVAEEIEATEEAMAEAPETPAPEIEAVTFASPPAPEPVRPPEQAPPVAAEEAEQPPVEEPVEPAQPQPVEEAALSDMADVVQPPAEPIEPAVVADSTAAAADLPDVDVPPTEPQPSIASEHTVFTLDDGTAIDLSQPVDALMSAHSQVLKEQLLESLDRDPLKRIIRFGTLLYPEAALASLGKNDLRRIRDDIIEAGEPLSDTAIIADLYHHRQSDYEAFRFALNHRLSREKDFEFVGVEDAYLWSVKGLPSIGSKRIKASEMAQLTSYLVEDYDDSLEGQNAETIAEQGAVSRFLTFFEWAYGVLVLDASLQALLPAPMLPDQRSAVLRIESPQHFTSYLVEVRYPTSNRGGWLQGLEEFFREHLIAGAAVTLERTDEPNVLSLVYEEIPGGNVDRVLTLDEKKNRFTFNDIDYFCAIDGNIFPSQQTFGRLKNLKALPMGERRKADLVLQHVFEVMGDQIGSREEPVYQADIDTLYVAYSVLRPASRPYLESLLESNDLYVADESVPGLYTYKPERDEDEEDEEDEEDLDDSVMQWGYDDDE